LLHHDDVCFDADTSKHGHRCIQIARGGHSSQQNFAQNVQGDMSIFIFIYCRLVLHISRRFCQVFPLRQSLLSNHKLRVKLVGLNDASKLESTDTTPDVYDLGRTMLWIAGAQTVQLGDVSVAGISLEPSNIPVNLETLRSYDPSLMLLLQWMTESDASKRAVMMDVLRHP
jgi:hypothetical protein